jgi:ribosome-binding factor A
MNRKVRMLCAQVERALGFALEEEVPHLAEHVLVEVVEPYPDAGSLLVLLREVAQSELETQELQKRVRQAKGRLRTSVASYINRKRAPELLFVVVGAEEVAL